MTRLGNGRKGGVTLVWPYLTYVSGGAYLKFLKSLLFFVFWVVSSIQGYKTMKRFLNILLFLVAMGVAVGAQAQTTSMCDKDNNLDCTALPTAEFEDMMYGFDNYVRTLLGLPPLLTPMITVCDKGSGTDCRQVPTALTNNFAHGLDAYLRNRAETTAVDAIAAADLTSTSEVNGLINTALAGYSTTSQMNTAISNAVADKVTSAQVSSAISSALGSYSTTAQMNTAIGTATSDKVTSSQLSTALAGYSTTSQMNTAITNATSDKVTSAQVGSAISTALADYSTTSDVNTAIAAATSNKVTAAQVSSAISAALDNYPSYFDVGQIAQQEATLIMQTELVNYATLTQAQNIADAAAQVALGAYVPAGPGVALGWYTEMASASHGELVTRLSPTQFRLDVTLPESTWVLPMVSSLTSGSDCFALPVQVGAGGGQPVVTVSCKISNVASGSVTPGQISIVFYAQ